MEGEVPGSVWPPGLACSNSGLRVWGPLWISGVCKPMKLLSVACVGEKEQMCACSHVHLGEERVHSSHPVSEWVCHQPTSPEAQDHCLNQLHGYLGPRLQHPCVGVASLPLSCPNTPFSTRWQRNPCKAMALILPYSCMTGPWLSLSLSSKSTPSSRGSKTPSEPQFFSPNKFLCHKLLGASLGELTIHTAWHSGVFQDEGLAMLKPGWSQANQASWSP